MRNHLGPLEELQPETDVRFTPGFMDTLLPRNLNDYVLILEDLLEKHETRCFLVNAGWHGGQIGQGSPLSASEENRVIDSMHHCVDWRPSAHLDCQYLPKNPKQQLPGVPRTVGPTRVTVDPIYQNWSA